ncbi:MAG: DUF1385 domain-containing protein [Lachnospiraceae bacterium]|nr:DUF1385 domain-containing protein [Lachnospiraceae bacterium]
MKPSGIGGQAVIEGVMMRNGGKYAVAVRTPDNEIVVDVQNCSSSRFGKNKIVKLPIIRGVVNFFDSMILGMKSLMFSASLFAEETEEEQAEREGKARKKAAAKAERLRKQGKDEAAAKVIEKCEEKLEKERGTASSGSGKDDNDMLMTLTVIFSLAFSIVLFMMLPYFISRLLRKVVASEMLILIVEGIVKLIIFIGYLALISRMKDIQRTFMYHGAEHKCINCIEHGLELNVENVRVSSREHKRCGTSFLFIVMFVSIVFIMVVSIPLFALIHVNTAFWRIVLRLALLPVIAGVSYEFIILAGCSDSKLVNLLSKPGMAMQHLTTKEPDDSMIEVAIASVEAVFDWRKFENEQFGTNYALKTENAVDQEQTECRGQAEHQEQTQTERQEQTGHQAQTERRGQTES